MQETCKNELSFPAAGLCFVGAVNGMKSNGIEAVNVSATPAQKA